MGSMCCFRACPCPGRAKTSPAKDPDFEEEGWSVDSEPYSPQNLDYLKSAVTIESRGKTEEAEAPESPPPSQAIVQGTGEDSYTIEFVSSLTTRTPSMLSEHRGDKDFPDISSRSDSKISPPDTERSQKAGPATVPIACSKPRIKSAALFQRNKSFRWEHAYYDKVEEPLDRTKKTVRSGRDRNNISPTIHQGQSQSKVQTNGQARSRVNCKSAGWCIKVNRTGQCILNHHQLRPIMDELKDWSMQVPGTVSIRYKHSSGLDAFLPWPDLRTGSKQEIKVFVDTVNSIEKRDVFHYVPVERDKSFATYKTSLGRFPPPSSSPDVYKMWT